MSEPQAAAPATENAPADAENAPAAAAAAEGAPAAAATNAVAAPAKQPIKLSKAKAKEAAQKELFGRIRAGDADGVTALLKAGLADANHVYQGGCVRRFLRLLSK